MIRSLRIVARIAFFAIVIAAVGGGAAAGVTLAYFSRDLPNDQQLLHYTPAIGSKIYASDGSLMLELASERRIFEPLGKIPPLVVHAFLAAEDRDFYKHNGVNPSAVFRAAMADLLRMQKGQRPLGASTITQQVVRHFFLTNEVSISRKIKEALLAYRIEKVLSKDQILEIYLNEIYLGAGSYGVAAAADTYFHKPLDKLTPAEAALLAALPKAPHTYNPIRNPLRAKERRDWVLSGMADVGFLRQDKARAAMAEPLGLDIRPPPPEQNGYFAEEVRRELVARFGDKAVYEGGLTVRTSYSPEYQAMAEQAFRDGLLAYDRRHGGWRGAVTHLQNPADAAKEFAGIPAYPGISSWKMAAVTRLDREGARIVLKGGGEGRIASSQLGWARYGHHAVAVGDVVYVEPVGTTPAAPARARRQKAAPAVEQYALRQIPEVSGGFVSLDPKTGRVLALVGGWDFQQSPFDRATQAMRQPGSAFKPLVYVTAMDHGFTPDSIVDDAPIEVSQGPGLPPWRPVNYEGDTVGPDTLRDALIHSRNLVTARLAMMVGMPTIAKTVENFDVMDRMPLYYSMALGAGETTVIRLTAAYAMLDNGGHWLLPSVIDTVQDRDGRIIYQKGVGTCAGCFTGGAPADGADNGASTFRADGAPKPADLPIANAQYADGLVVYRPTKPDPLVSPTADAEIVSMMQGVVQQGTGIEVAAVGKPLAGKTGTTSDWKDAWFVGFSPNLAAGVYVGFDEPRTLGHGEVGGKVSAPIFRDFMIAALKNVPATPFEAPPGAAVAIASAAAAPPLGRQDAADDESEGAFPYALVPPAAAAAPPQGQAGYPRQPPPPPWAAAGSGYPEDRNPAYGRQPYGYGPGGPNQYATTEGGPYPAQGVPYGQAGASPYGDTSAGRSGQRARNPYWQSPPPRYGDEAGANPYQATPYGIPGADYGRAAAPQYGTVAPPPPYWQDRGRYGPNPGTY